MILSLNFYYAVPGLEEAVLRQRLRASDVRERLNIPRGRVLRRVAGSGEVPDVIWENTFPNVAAHLCDMTVRGASAEFEAIRAGMRKLYRRFERPLYEICGDSAWRENATGTEPARVGIDWIFCEPDRCPQALAAVRMSFPDESASGGYRMLRAIAPERDLPPLLLQQELVWASPSQPAPAAKQAAAWREALNALGATVVSTTWAVA